MFMFRWRNIVSCNMSCIVHWAFCCYGWSIASNVRDNGFWERKVFIAMQGTKEFLSLEFGVGVFICGNEANTFRRIWVVRGGFRNRWDRLSGWGNSSKGC